MAMGFYNYNFKIIAIVTIIIYSYICVILVLFKKHFYGEKGEWCVSQAAFGLSFLLRLGRGCPFMSRIW